MREIIRIRSTEKASGKKKSGIYADVAAGKFPKPVKIGARASGWFSDEIAVWQEALAAKRDGRLSQYLAAREAERGQIESWLLALAAECDGAA